MAALRARDAVDDINGSGGGRGGQTGWGGATRATSAGGGGGAARRGTRHSTLPRPSMANDRHTWSKANHASFQKRHGGPLRQLCGAPPRLLRNTESKPHQQPKRLQLVTNICYNKGRPELQGGKVNNFG